MSQAQAKFTIDSITKAITIYMIVVIVLECIFFPAWENVFGCIVLMYGWLLISLTVLKQEYLYKYFLPFVTIFFLGVFFCALPLGATLIEGKPVTFRFNVPYLTFFNLALNVTTIVLAFHTCRKIYKQGWLSNIWDKLGYFKPPTPAQMWAMGIIGLASMLFVVYMQDSEASEAENLGFTGHLIKNLAGFAIIPLTLFFSKYYRYGKVNVNFFTVALYLLLLVLIGVATTKRTLMLTGIAVCALVFFWTLILENRRLFNANTNIAIVVGIYLITGPVADLATAMILNRQLVHSETAGTTFSEVWKLYSDKELLHQTYSMATLSNTDNLGDNYSSWSEYYVDNIILDRVCNLRTQDLTLDYAKHLGYGSETMKEYARNYIVFQVPTPILRAFGYTGNKFEHLYTPGDLMSTKALGLRGQYYGYRVAGDSGVGLYWLGYSYYFVAFLIYVLVFYFFSSLTRYSPMFVLPIPVMIDMVFYMTYFNNATGIFRSITLLLRSGLQDILLYVILFAIVRFFVRRINLN